MVLQLGFQGSNRRKGVCNGGNRLVIQLKLLPPAGKLPVVLPCCFPQGIIKSGTVGNQDGTHPAQPTVVLRQNFQHGGIVLPILENPPLLLQNPAVFRQGCVIIGAQLTQGIVPEFPPGGGTGFENHQILRAEQHRGQQPIEVCGGFFLHPVDLQLPGLPGGKQQPADALLPLLGGYLPFQLTEGSGKANHLCIFQRPEALAAAQKSDGLQQIGLSLGILPHNQVHAGGKFQPLLAIVAEGAEVELIQPHEFQIVCPDRQTHHRGAASCRAWCRPHR